MKPAMEGQDVTEVRGEGVARPLSWARVLTEVFQPPVALSILFLLMPVLQTGRAIDMLYGLLAAALVCLGPLAIIVVLVRVGVISDHHVSNRRQRAPILGGTFVLACIAIWLLVVLDAPSHLTATVVSILTGMVAMIIISPFWKLSGHASTLSGIITVAILAFGWPAVPLIIIQPFVCVARVRLRDHTVAQVVTGTIAGIVLTGVPYWLLTAS